MLQELWYFIASEIEWLFTGLGAKATQTVWPRLKTAAFNVWVAIDMLLCAVFFSFWSKPRETLSGFVGRLALMGSSIALWIAKRIDWLYRASSPAHCGETALAEDESRFVLYPDMQIGMENLEEFNPENKPKGM